MNRPKVTVVLKVSKDCIIEPGLLLVPYIVQELKHQLSGKEQDAVLNRLYYNVRVRSNNITRFGIPALGIREMQNFGIYVKEVKA